jgi:chemotaxis protein CheD
MSSVPDGQRDAPESEPASVRRLYLYPGQIATSREPLLVTTILGSCVSICMWDPESRIGGINHFLLPKNPLGTSSDLRYGNTATERLIEELLANGVNRQRIVARLVGGASILPPFAGARQSIGDQNVDAARQLLAKHGIAGSGEQTGGIRGRKLVFHTGNGCAFIKDIRP